MIYLDQEIRGGLFEVTHLKIILPKNIKPIKSLLTDKCVTLTPTYENDTLRVKFDTDGLINWNQLNLSIKTRDTIYNLPMSDFDEISKEVYSGGIYTLAFREYQNNQNE